MLKRMYVQNMYILMYVLQLMMDVNSNIYMDIDEYQQMWMNVNKLNSSTIIKHHSFVPLLHSPTCYYFIHIMINNTKPYTHSFM